MIHDDMTCNFKAIIKKINNKNEKTMRRMKELTINRGIIYLLSIYQERWSWNGSEGYHKKYHEVTVTIISMIIETKEKEIFIFLKDFFCCWIKSKNAFKMERKCWRIEVNALTLQQFMMKFLYRLYILSHRCLYLYSQSQTYSWNVYKKILNFF